MRRRDVVSLLGGAAAAGVAGPAFGQAEPAKPAQIVVNHSGGSMGSAMRKAFFNGYEKKYGIKVVETSPADFGKLRAMVEFGQRRMGRHRDRRPGRDPRRQARPRREDRRQDRRPLEVSREGAHALRLRLVGLHHDHRLPHRRLQRRHAAQELGGLVGRQEIPRRALDAQPSDRQPRIRADRRRRADGQGLSHRLRPRLQEARPDQAACHGMVVDRPAAGPAAARQGGRAGDRLERPLLRHHQEGRAGRDRMERGRAEAGQLRHPQGRQECLLGAEDAGRDVGAAAAGGLRLRARLSRPQPGIAQLRRCQGEALSADAVCRQAVLDQRRVVRRERQQGASNCGTPGC